MNLNKLLSELKRRNVFKVATAYAVTAWVLIQVVVAIEQPLSLPGNIDTIVIIVLLIGFPVTLIIAWIYEWTNKGLQKTAAVDREKSITSTTGRKLNQIIITSLSILVIFLLVERIFFAGNLFTEEKPSIAVLPFDNQSIDPENEYFADGLAEELINELAHIQGLKVIARTSSFIFKDKGVSLKEIAERLGVNHVLTGSVRKSGDQLRISTQLIKVEDETSVWSKSYSREFSDIFNIQSEISKAAIKELRVKLLPEDEKSISDRPTENPAAYALYLRTLQFKNTNPDSLRLAVELLKEVITLDSSFAKAHAALSMHYGLLISYGNVEYNEALGKMKFHVDKAVAIAPNDAEVLRARAWYYRDNYQLGDSRFKTIEEDLLKAVDLVPNYALAYNDLQIALRDQNRIIEADSVLLLAFNLDPLDKTLMANVAGLYSNRDQKDKAVELVEEGLKLYPNYAPLYTQMISFIRQSPYGRLDKAFILAHEASKKFPKNVRVLDIMVELSKQLDMPPLTDQYLDHFLSLYPENFDAITELISTKAYNKEYDFILSYAESLKGRYGDLAVKPMAGLTSMVYYNKGEFEKSQQIIEDFFPEALDLSFDFESIKDQQVHNDHSIALRNYTILLTQQGSSKAKDYLQKLETHWNYHDSISDSKTSQKSAFISELLNEYKEVSITKLYSKLNGAILKNNAQEAVDIIEDLYFTKRAYSDAWEDINSDHIYGFISNEPAFQSLLNHIKEDVYKQRAEVVAYLKEKGEWQEKWDAEID